jgi:hypothetical protein
LPSHRKRHVLATDQGNFNQKSSNYRILSASRACLWFLKFSGGPSNGEPSMESKSSKISLGLDYLRDKTMSVAASNRASEH